MFVQLSSSQSSVLWNHAARARSLRSEDGALLLFLTPPAFHWCSASTSDRLSSLSLHLMLYCDGALCKSGPGNTCNVSFFIISLFSGVPDWTASLHRRRGSGRRKADSLLLNAFLCLLLEEKNYTIWFWYSTDLILFFFGSGGTF